MIKFWIVGLPFRGKHKALMVSLLGTTRVFWFENWRFCRLTFGKK